ncbi:DUF3710 domain-containing protein [Lysinibacter sp. HNR]|uniref:DUF3710 domain-containing protein n=1 Tax=Lysinibacter sp. HNR TaxID=3031408 RepID=UPI002434D015|nr:DUF3710 domain-containing protein [Lysinibacter sp. HNR]WGD36334.1 DUF3710 domain-containing protein [Lysinibacter sp. HNR]
MADNTKKTDDSSAESEGASTEPTVDESKSAPTDREVEGPFDASEASAVRPYVDLGSLKILPREGIQMRLDVEEGTQRIVAVSLDYHQSTLQLQAFSAPRSTGLWHEVREQIREQLVAQKARVDEREDVFGPELEAVITAADGGSNRVRFIGVDGPRWLLRGVVSGAALSDDDAREKIYEIFRSVVVVRGEQPLPPRDLLALRVPAAAAGEAGTEQGSLES